MRTCLALVALAACSTPPPPASPDAAPPPPADAAPLASVWDSVDPASLNAELLQLTGATAVTVNGSTFNMTNRWSIDAKANFRAFWTQYMTGLGATVSTLEFPIDQALIGEKFGHNVEAVFPGDSPDTIVIITHYDTVGITHHETENPGADDAGTGLALQMEAARIFVKYPHHKYTVRFVVADYEEISNNLNGDFAYVSYLKQQAKAQGFTIVAASDGDQTGWSCWSEGLCGSGAPAPNSTFQMISSSGAPDNFDYPDLSAQLIQLAADHASPLAPTAVTDDSGDTDHYPFWVAGIPAYVIEEWGANNNPHFDDAGGDVMATIDMDLFANIARIQIAFQAQLAGIGP
jgi:hypothetical protein